jgi:hypothetical protein
MRWFKVHVVGVEVQALAGQTVTRFFLRFDRVRVCSRFHHWPSECPRSLSFVVCSTWPWPPRWSIDRCPALLVANKERSAYGLRYNDFQRYRYDKIPAQKLSPEPLTGSIVRIESTVSEAPSKSPMARVANSRNSLPLLLILSRAGSTFFPACKGFSNPVRAASSFCSLKLSVRGLMHKSSWP